MLPGAHPSPVILQLENLFFLFFCAFWNVFFRLFVWKVWESERNIDQVFWLDQWRWPNRDATCWLGLSPRLFGRVLMIFFLCVCEKRSSGIGVAAYWILWARPKYFGAAFLQILLLLKTTFFCRSFLNGRPLYPVTCVQPIIDRPITERQWCVGGIARFIFMWWFAIVDPA